MKNSIFNGQIMAQSKISQEKLEKVDTTLNIFFFDKMGTSIYFVYNFYRLSLRIVLVCVLSTIPLNFKVNFEWLNF